MKYIDFNGNEINYGDILKAKKPLWNYDEEYACKEPFFVLVKEDGKDMIYTSANDEYWEINDCKLKTDKINELKAFEIFVYREVYEGLLKKGE